MLSLEILDMFLFIQYIMFVVKRSNYWNLELDNIYFLDSHSYTKCWQKKVEIFSNFSKEELTEIMRSR